MIHKGDEIISLNTCTNGIVCFFDLGIAASSGSMWKEHRTFALTTLRSFGFGKRSLENQIMDETELLLNDINDTKGKPFDIQSFFSVSICNVMSSLLFGKHYDHDDARLHTLIRMVNANLSTPAGIVGILPWLRHLPGDLFGINVQIKRMNEVLGFIKEIVEEHRRTFDDNNIRDFTDAYLAEQKRQANVKGSTFTGDEV